MSTINGAIGASAAPEPMFYALTGARYGDSAQAPRREGSESGSVIAGRAAAFLV
jgi:hypothetical protein